MADRTGPDAAAVGPGTRSGGDPPARACGPRRGPGRNLAALMGQQPNPAPRPSRACQPGEIDFRLARNAVLAEFRKGRLTRNDVCDAHPDLIRAARNIGEETPDACPICETGRIVNVSYAFGSGLPAGGHTVAGDAELRRLARRARGLSCYVVEVCAQCGWNHLARTFPVARTRSGT